MLAGGYTESSTAEYAADEADSVTPEDFITVNLGLPSFYAEWLQQDRYGTPILSVTDISPDATACVDTGGGDNDGDGWSFTAECNDAEPTWNPGIAPGPLTGDDTNCDGW